MRRVALLSWIVVSLAAAPRLRADSASDLESGRRVFQVHCAMCHGPGGEGGKGPTLAQPTLPRASDDESLRHIIRDGITDTEMPNSHLGESDVKLVAAFVKSLGSHPQEAVPGDPARGKQIYETKGACAQCHTLHGHGGAVGPALDDIGLRRSAAYLRRALVEPGAEIPQSYSAFRWDVRLPLNFLYVRAITRDGVEIDGVRVNEDTFSIQIRDVAGHVHSFFKSDLAELHKDFGKTPMPSFANALTKDELDDLTAYLTTLRSHK